MNKQAYPTINMKSLLFASVGAIAIAAPAAAQQDTIVITAAKREQTLQEVPIAVSVVGADSIEKARALDLIDLQNQVPSFRIGQLQNSTQTTFTIRGFGNGANNQALKARLASLLMACSVLAQPLRFWTFRLLSGWKFCAGRNLPYLVRTPQPVQFRLLRKNQTTSLAARLRLVRQF